MKKLTTTLLAFFCIASISLATQWSVSNSIQNPGQYSTIVAAIAGAASGDTLLMHPTATSYGSFTLDKPLVIIGGGFNTQKINAFYSTLGTVTLIPAASGSKFFGLRLSTLNGTTTGVYDQIHVENCYFSAYINFGASAGVNVTNLLVRNCVMDELRLGSNTSNSVLVTNCIFEGYGVFGSSGNLVMSQCLFQGHTQQLFSVSGAIFQDCIFYDGAFWTVTLSTFNNCISFNLTDNTLPPGSNIGGGNISGVDPMFVNNPLNAAYAFTNRDFHLMAGSPALTGATDGGQIGLYGTGSTFSNSGEPLNSAITRSFTITNAAVPVNGNLNIDVTITKPLDD